MTLAMYKEMECENQNTFKELNKELKLNLVHEYRKLELMSYAMADGEDSPFDYILNIIQSYFPAFAWNQIHDDEDDVNDTYYELIEDSRNERISDEEFLKRLMEKVK